MSATFRKSRWECSQCGMVNRAYRDVCFRESCGLPRTQKNDGITNDDHVSINSETTKNDNATVTTTCQQHQEIVEFKDENSKVIAQLPLELAQVVRSDLVYMVQNLVQESSTVISSTAATTTTTSDHDGDEQQDGDSTTRSTTTTTTTKDDHIRRATALQKQMRKGLQIVSDFDDPVALWIYSKRKFFSRAITAFELLRNANTILLKVLDPDGTKNNNESDSKHGNLFYNADILSFGGGPGNDLFGALLFEKYGDSSESPRVKKHDRQRFLGVYDFAPGWKPIVESVSKISGHDITFETCDLTYGLDTPTNNGLSTKLLPLSKPHEQAQRDPSSKKPNELSPTTTIVRVYLFCYVLSEVMGPSGKPPVLLKDLLALASHGSTFQDNSNDTMKHIFLFREPHRQALKTLLNTSPYDKGWKEGTNYWHLSCGGLMVLIEN